MRLWRACHAQPVAFGVPCAANSGAQRVVEAPTERSLAMCSSRAGCRVPGALEAQLDPHVALFRTMERCFSTLEALAASGCKAEPRATVPEAPQRGKRGCAGWPALFGWGADSSLTEREAKAVSPQPTACPSSRSVGEQRCRGTRDGCEARFPSGAESRSPDLPHKTEAGVIRLNLRTAEDVQVAFDAVMANARPRPQQARSRWCWCQPMLPSVTGTPPFPPSHHQPRHTVAAAGPSPSRAARHAPHR